MSTKYFKDLSENDLFFYGGIQYRKVSSTHGRAIISGDVIPFPPDCKVNVLVLSK